MYYTQYHIIQIMHLKKFIKLITSFMLTNRVANVTLLAYRPFS